MDLEIKKITVDLKQGNKTAFSSVFEMYHRKIYGFCLNHYHDHQEAEEVVQEVFLKLWINREKLNENLNLQSYLFTIAKNIIISNIREKIRHKTIEEYKFVDTDKISDSVENEIVFKDLEEYLYKTTETFPARRKEVFMLSRREGLSNKEISEKLNISLKTVEAHIQLSLNYLRKLLKLREILFLIIFLL